MERDYEVGLRNQMRCECWGGFNWLAGCAIAAALVLIVLFVSVFAVSRVVKKGFEEGKKQLVVEFAVRYTEWNEKKLIPETAALAFEEIANVTQRDDVSFWTVLLCLVASENVLEDGSVSEAETESLNDLAAFVKPNPGAGLSDFTAFLQTHPDFKGVFESSRGEYDSSGGNQTDPDPATR